MSTEATSEQQGQNPNPPTPPPMASHWLLGQADMQASAPLRTTSGRISDFSAYTCSFSSSLPLAGPHPGF